MTIIAENDGTCYNILEYVPIPKIIFFRPGTYTIRIHETPHRRPSNPPPPIITERIITILGYDFSTFHQYKAIYAPYDYWITPNDYGLNYYKNGNREILGMSYNPRTGQSSLLNDPTHFRAVLDPLNYEHGPLLVGIAERRWRRYPDSFPGSISYTPYSYATHEGSYEWGEETVPGSDINGKFWIYKYQQPSTVPLYSIRKIMSTWDPVRWMYIRSANFDYLSTVNEVEYTQYTETVAYQYLLETQPGVIVGYVFPIKATR